MTPIARADDGRLEPRSTSQTSRCRHRTAFDGATRLKILAASPVDRPAGGALPGTVLGVSPAGLLVACGKGALEITTLQPEGKRAMSALDYARGARSAQAFHDGD